MHPTLLHSTILLLVMCSTAGRAQILPRNQEGMTTLYTKVVATDEVKDGWYLIVNERTSSVFDGRLGGPDNKLDQAHNYVNSIITIKDNTIAGSADVDAAVFHIETSVEGRTIRSASGYYIGRTASSNGLNEDNSVAYTNRISIDASGDAVVVGTSGYHLRFNGSSGSNNMRFRYYSSSSQQPIQLYKQSFIPVTTGIDGIDGKISDHGGQSRMEVQQAGWYTIDGQPIEGRPTRKGLYIHAGNKKIIIR